MKRRQFSMLVFAGMFVLSTVGSAMAQQKLAGIDVSHADVRSGPTVVGRPTSPLWGTVDQVLVTISAEQFVPADSSETWTYDPFNGNGRIRTGGGGFMWFDAAPDLPAGVQIMQIEMEGCDTSATAHISTYLFVTPSPSGGVALARLATSGADANVPGCDFFFVDTSADNIFVDRWNNRYTLRIEISGTDNTTSVRAVRVYYKLRVKPAPVTASFTDVPTSHPFFQYIEALKASGVTGGCVASPPQYCPNDPVTRGQMAVFLSRLVGLHFPF